MQKKKRGSSRYFVLFIFLLLAIYFAFLGMKKIFMKMDFFNIEKIEISGNRILEEDFLMNISLDLIGQNLLMTSKREVYSKYENIARIKEIRIRKKLPAKLVIKIEERNAILQIKTDSGELFPIDGEGIFLDNENFDIREILPIVNTQIKAENIVFGTGSEDEFLHQIITLYHEIRKADNDFFNSISQIYKDDDEIYFIEVENGFRIILGESNIPEKIKRYNFVEKNRKFEKNSIIDLRFNDKLIIRSEDK